MIAIHLDGGEFTTRWIDYLTSNSTSFIEVNIYNSDIISILKENNVSVLFAHLPHYDHRTSLIAKSILLSVERSGIGLFPNHNTFWHYDDKIKEYYLLKRKVEISNSDLSRLFRIYTTTINLENLNKAPLGTS